MEWGPVSQPCYELICGATRVQEQIGIFLSTMTINDIVVKDGWYIAVGDQGKGATDKPVVGIEEVVMEEPMFNVSPDPASDNIPITIEDALHEAFMLNIFNHTRVLMK